MLFFFFEKQENTLQFMSKQWNQSYFTSSGFTKNLHATEIKKNIKGT